MHGKQLLSGLTVADLTFTARGDDLACMLHFLKSCSRYRRYLVACMLVIQANA
jgi:hypothetical protein